MDCHGLRALDPRGLVMEGPVATETWDGSGSSLSEESKSGSNPDYGRPRPAIKERH